MWKKKIFKLNEPQKKTAKSLQHCKKTLNTEIQNDFLGKFDDKTFTIIILEIFSVDSFFEILPISAEFQTKILIFQNLSIFVNFADSFFFNCN